MSENRNIIQQVCQLIRLSSDPFILWVLRVARWDLHGLDVSPNVWLNFSLGNLEAWSVPWGLCCCSWSWEVFVAWHCPALGTTATGSAGFHPHMYIYLTTHSFPWKFCTLARWSLLLTATVSGINVLGDQWIFTFLNACPVVHEVFFLLSLICCSISLSCKQCLWWLFSYTLSAHSYPLENKQ